jgi:hypothetical protein
MKNLALIIIMIGVLMGGSFLLIGFLIQPIEFIAATIFFVPCLIAIPITISFLFISVVEQKKIVNTHKAMLLPWFFLPVAVIVIIIFNLLVALPVFKISLVTGNLIVQIPLILVFLSAGGAWAHQRRLNNIAV